jgi:hypothetical protein
MYFLLTMLHMRLWTLLEEFLNNTLNLMQHT